MLKSTNDHWLIKYTLPGQFSRIERSVILTTKKGSNESQARLALKKFRDTSRYVSGKRIFAQQESYIPTQDQGFTGLIYHGTSYSNWTSIQQNGLQQKSLNKLYNSTEVLGGVYVAKDPLIAYQFAINAASKDFSDPIVLVIKAIFNQLQVEPDHDNITDFLLVTFNYLFPQSFQEWETYNDDFDGFKKLAIERLSTFSNQLMEDLKPYWEDVAVVYWKYLLDKYLASGETDQGWLPNYYVALKNLTERSKWMAVKGKTDPTFAIYNDIGFTGATRIIAAALFDAGFPRMLYGTPENAVTITNPEYIYGVRQIVPKQKRTTQDINITAESVKEQEMEKTPSELSEMSTSILTAYTKKASDQVKKIEQTNSLARQQIGHGGNDSSLRYRVAAGQETLNKRRAGIDAAAKQKLAKESVENSLEELAFQTHFKYQRVAKKEGRQDGVDRSRRLLRNQKYVDSVSKKSVKEEVEELSEISQGVLKRYINRVKPKRHQADYFTKEMEKIEKERGPSTGVGGVTDVKRYWSGERDKRDTGIARAKARLKENLEPLDELSKNLLRKYIDKGWDDWERRNNDLGETDDAKKEKKLHSRDDSLRRAEYKVGDGKDSRYRNRVKIHATENVDGTIPVNSSIKGQNTKAGAGLMGTWQVLKKYMDVTPGQSNEIETITPPLDKPFKRNVQEDFKYTISLDKVDSKAALLFAHKVEDFGGEVTGVTSAKVSVSSKENIEDSFATIADDLGVGIAINQEQTSEDETD